MTSNNGNEKKEFWILDSVSTDLPQVYDYEPDHFNSVYNEHIHVISIDAYRELEKENAELRKVYNSVCPECGYSGCVRGRKACDTEIDKLKKGTTKLRQALEKIKCNCHHFEDGSKYFCHRCEALETGG